MPLICCSVVIPVDLIPGGNLPAAIYGQALQLRCVVTLVLYVVDLRCWQLQRYGYVVCYGRVTARIRFTDNHVVGLFIVVRFGLVVTPRSIYGYTAPCPGPN